MLTVHNSHNLFGGRDIFGDVVSMLALPKLLFSLSHLPYRKNIPPQQLFHTVACIPELELRILVVLAVEMLSHSSSVVLSF
jgi:hypothetical protein